MPGERIMEQPYSGICKNNFFSQTSMRVESLFESPDKPGVNYMTNLVKRA